MTQTASGYYQGPSNGGGGGGISIPGVLRAFRRKIPLMLIIFIALSALGWYLGSQMKRTYSAEARLMVTQGVEHVYQPLTGQNNGGLVTTPDSITLNEIGIMTNPQLIEGVMGTIGLNKLYPEKSNKYKRASGLEKQNLFNEMLSEFESSFAAAARPKSSIIDMKFEHESPRVATDTLNAIISAYMDERRTLFVDGQTGALAERRAATEEQLATVERAISRFMRRNQIADFESERVGSRKRLEDLRAEQNTLLASMREAEAALMSTEDSLRSTPPTIELQIDDRPSQRIAQAELERRQLLAKYLPTSDVVQAKDREIRELRQLIASNGARAAGGRRIGPNTVHQALMTERNKFQAQADSYREKAVIIQRQLDAAVAQTARLSSLAPQVENLLREKTSLEERLTSLNLREQEALVEQQTAESNAENVKVIAEAGRARKGRNMKKIVQFLSVIGAGMTALMVGLLATFLDPSIYGPGSGRAVGNTGRKDADLYQDQYVPEAVPSYTPYEAQPAYAPAAAAAGGVAATGYNQADYQTPYMNTTSDPATPYVEPYVQPMQATGTDGMAYQAQPYSPQAYGATYTDPSNPYAVNVPVQESTIQYSNAPAPAYQGVQEVSEFVAGPSGEMIPVIGGQNGPTA